MLVPSVTRKRLMTNDFQQTLRPLWEQIFLDTRQTALFLPKERLSANVCVPFSRTLFLKQRDSVPLTTTKDRQNTQYPVVLFRKSSGLCLAGRSLPSNRSTGRSGRMLRLLK